MRAGNGLSDGLREAGLRRHAEMASKLLVDYGLSEECSSVALTMIDRFIFIEVPREERRTATAMQAIKDEFLASMSFKKLVGRERAIARKELIKGLGAARQALQEAFDQKDSWPELVAA